MPTSVWNINGQYYQTCNCDFICPCIPGRFAVRPTQGGCQFAMAFQIEHGTFDTLSLDGLGFIILGWTPGEMAKGSWSVGVVTDSRATGEQRDAIVLIAIGAAGGPMAVLSPLIGTFLGVESASIFFDREGGTWSVSAPNLIDMAAVGAKGLNPDVELQLENTGHPAADTLTLARASRSHVHAFGLGWNEVSGEHNGQYAPFSWKRT
jgi:hypothetical protein